MLGNQYLQPILIMETMAIILLTIVAIITVAKLQDVFSKKIRD